MTKPIEKSNEDLLAEFLLTKRDNADCGHIISQLINQNQGLIHSILDRCFYKHPEQDDLKQEANLALLLAIHGFAESSGPGVFANYAGMWIYYRVKNLIRRAMLFKSGLDVLEYVSQDVVDRKDEIDYEEIRNQAQRFLMILTDPQHLLIVRRFCGFDGKAESLKEIADYLGISHTRVEQGWRRALYLMRKGACE